LEARFKELNHFQQFFVNSIEYNLNRKEHFFQHLTGNGGTGKSNIIFYLAAK